MRRRSSKQIALTTLELVGGWSWGVEAFDLGAYVLEFFYDLFVAAVDVVDAFDDGFALGY